MVLRQASLFFFDRIIAFLMTVVDNGVRKEVKFGADV